MKPEIIEDAETAALPDRAFRMFVSLITLADDYGRGQANPPWLLGRVFWAQPDAEVDWVRETLARLSRDGFIQLYAHHGQPYFWLKNWKKHQKVDHPGRARIPSADEDDGSVDWERVLGKWAPRETPMQPSRDSRESLARPPCNPREAPGESSRDPHAILANDLGPRTKDLGSRISHTYAPKSSNAPAEASPAAEQGGVSVSPLAELERSGFRKFGAIPGGPIRAKLRALMPITPEEIQALGETRGRSWSYVAKVLPSWREEAAEAESSPTRPAAPAPAGFQAFPESTHDQA